MADDVKLMDVTTREGSYVIDYKFTASQVSEIARAVDEAGIPYMEVGNGGGLGVPQEYYRGIKPQSTDMEQVRAAKKAVKKCKIGLLANPAPITKKEHIEAVQKEVDFLRIVARIDNIQAAKDNVATARSLNIPVFFQMMRSSKRAPSEILEAAKEVEAFGADVVYVVDTIGFFLPEDVYKIIQTLKATLKIAVGFHAHNNLGLAVANSLRAVEAGADYVDGSLLGLGRDAGNAQLEALVAALQRIGKAKEIDFRKLIAAAKKFVQPIVPQRQGAPPLQVATAASNVCLYPMELYQQVAKAAEIDFFDLIGQMGKDPQTEPDLKKALQALGKDANAVFKKLGLA